MKKVPCNDDAALIASITVTMARTQMLAATIWEAFIERAFTAGDGRLFLAVSKPAGDITIGTCVSAFAAHRASAVDRTFVRFQPGETPVIKNIENPIFIVLDLCRSMVEDVISPTGVSLLGKGEPSPAIDAGEQAYNLVPRLEQAVKSGVQPFRVPDTLLWAKVLENLEPDQLQKVNTLMKHDPTCVKRLESMEAANDRAKEGVKS